MEDQLNLAFKKEIKISRELIEKQILEEAFYHLERAHVLGQRYVIPHTQTHFLMLKVGLLRKDFKEVFGQLFRIPLGVLGSLIGVVPTGNTGGSKVSAFLKMEISPDLRKIMDDSRERR